MPRVIKVARRTLGCSEIEFAEACDRVLFRQQGRGGARGQSHIGQAATAMFASVAMSPDDVKQNFILFMLTHRKWREHRWAVGTVEAFVWNWFKRYSDWSLGRNSRHRSERRRRSGVDVHRAAGERQSVDARLEQAELQERVQRAMRLIPEPNREAIIATVRLGATKAKMVHDDTALSRDVREGKVLVREVLSSIR